MYQEGQTATNPKTGQKVVFKGGQWVSANNPMQDRSSALSAADRTTIADLRVAGQNIRGAREQAFEFVKGNARQPTGGLMAIPGVSEIAGAWDPQVSTLQGLSNAMIPGMHVTPGPMTDADAKLYKSAIPNPNLPRETNTNLAKDISRKEQQIAARSAFFERWAQRTGSLNGADVAFNKFWSSYQPPAAAPSGGGTGGGARYLGTED